MCSKNNCVAKTAEFDKALLEFFERWRDFVKQHNSKEDLLYTNWLEDFCSYVWESLVIFEEMGRLKEPLKPK